MSAGEVRVTILVDNWVPQGSPLTAEHGFSALVENPAGAVLVDTGQSNRWARNAARLGLDPARFTKLFLSHGHYDHTGGLVADDMLPEGCEIITHPDAFTPKYGWTPGAAPRYLGVPLSVRELTEQGYRVSLTKEPVVLLPGVRTLGETPRTHGHPSTDPRLRVKRRDRFVPDPLRDDGALVIDTPRGWVVLTGCAHSGLSNILYRAAEVARTERLHAVLGGTHLTRADGPQVDEALAALSRFQVDRVGPCHCTSPGAARRLAAEYGDAFLDLGAGSRVTFAN